jgi:hypothetical protein
MRWNNLFDDLESQLEQELSAEDVDLRAEEERLRLARLGIRDRLFSLHNQTSGEGDRVLRLILGGGVRISVVPNTFGRDWFAGELVEESGRRPPCIVPIEAIEGVILGRRQVGASLDNSRRDESPGSLSARLGLQFVLRDLCRRRQPIELRLADGRLHGTIDRVGRDHLDLAIHEADHPRRETEVTEYRILSLSQVLLVRL